jgi:1,2-diacylglycerol 3-alpha-glucosyltransferase
MISQQTRVAVLFRRLGPYHHARLNAAGKLMEIFGVEACGMEETYAWEKVDGAISFIRMTLTDRQVNNREWKQRLHRQMQSALNATKPQIVVVPGWSSTDSLSALSWCLETNTPAVMMSESTEWDERRVPWKEWIKRRMIQLCSAALTGGTPHTDYLKKLGLPQNRIFLGYDAVDNEYFAAMTAELRTPNSPPSVAELLRRTGELRTPLGLPENYFLASARFVEKKNLPRLIEAYARYRTLCEDHRPPDNGQRDNGLQDHRTTGLSIVSSQSSVVSSPSPVVSGPVVPWSLVLLGDGPLRSTLNSQLSTLNLQPHVHLPGFKQYDVLPVYYGLAKAFIHASTTEQWGLVVNEAMASGLPVLVSNRCGCAADLVQEGVNGFTFDPYNVEQLAQLMLKISAFNFPLSAFGSESQRIISDWGPERFANGLKQAVECALRVGPVKPTLVQSMILKAMLAR